MLPTVLKEAHNVINLKNIKLRQNYLTMFRYINNCEIVSYPENESTHHFIEVLTEKFINSKKPAFIPNKNKKHAFDDARIMAEACFANVDIITFDKDFSNVKRIREIAATMRKEIETYNLKNFNPNVKVIFPREGFMARVQQQEI